MIFDIVSVAITFVEIIAFLSLLGVFAEEKNWYKKYKIPYVLLMTIINIAIVYLLDSFMYIKFVVMVLFYFSLAISSFKMKKSPASALAMMYFNSVGIIEYIVAIVIFKIGLFKEISEQGQPEILQAQILLVEMIIEFMLVFIGKKYKGKLKETMNILEKREWTGIFVVSLFSLAIIAVSTKESGMQENNYMDLIVALLGISIAFMYLAIVQLFVGSAKRQKHILENEAILNRVKNETMLYHAITENVEKQSRRIHEFNNRMTAIKSMLDQGKIEELKQYVDTIEEKSKEYPQIFNTKNAIVDAIMTAKYEEMVNNNILLVHKFSELEEVKIADDDLVILLSNLLNNAIEACMKAEKRTVKVKFVVDDKDVVLSVTNTIGSKPSEIEGELISTKNNEMGEHGIGLKNVREIVEKYHGSYSVNYDEEWFFVAILIPR